ncbi:MAGE family-domain-containing protein [Mycotypha africana]|uniref:MAGE family-domain-containing protein n=1 Tax=Mycotypha africana TaxID=64632 RepID=UPI0023012E38|nr:MAGE family-domain-containing protein [Mycotypha africana]KAI8990824.1 MAGE family-domain-containing protein [Mycotypha africana]
MQTQNEQTQERQPQMTQSQRRSPATGNYVVISILKEFYRKPDIIERSADEYKTTGILYIILGIIFLSGQQMNSSELYNHLDSLKLTKNNTEFGSRDELLSSFIKGGYLRRTQIPDADNEEPEYNYTWGPRANVELGHTGVVSFLSSVSNTVLLKNPRAIADCYKTKFVVVWRKP